MGAPASAHAGGPIGPVGAAASADGPPSSPPPVGVPLFEFELPQPARARNWSESPKKASAVRFMASGPDTMLHLPLQARVVSARLPSMAAPGASAPSPANLVSLRDARERAIAQLSDAFAHDVIELDDFERRLALVHRASSVPEVAHTVSDLTESAAPIVLASAAHATGALAPQGNARPLVAIFGGLDSSCHRASRWRCRARRSWAGSITLTEPLRKPIPTGQCSAFTVSQSWAVSRPPNRSNAALRPTCRRRAREERLHRKCRHMHGCSFFDATTVHVVSIIGMFLKNLQASLSPRSFHRNQGTEISSSCVFGTGM